jgi:hypothetical protein
MGRAVRSARTAPRPSCAGAAARLIADIEATMLGATEQSGTFTPYSADIGHCPGHNCTATLQI